MNITTPAQAFALRDKLATILGTQLQGYSSEVYQVADAETLLGLGIIDVARLSIHGEPIPEPAVAHGDPLDEAGLEALPRYSFVELASGERAWKRDDDESPWNTQSMGYTTSAELATANPQFIA
jgi:hypothetical protein